MFPQPLSHHREPWRWYLQSCSNDVPSFTDDSLSTPSTPSRTSPDAHCPTHSSLRPEEGSRDCDNAKRCFWPPNTAFPTAPRSVSNRSGISLLSPNTTPPPTLHLPAFSPHRAGDCIEWFQRTSLAPDWQHRIDHDTSPDSAIRWDCCASPLAIMGTLLISCLQHSIPSFPYHYWWTLTLWNQWSKFAWRWFQWTHQCPQPSTSIPTEFNFAVIVLLSSELLIATYHGIVIEILNSK